MTEIDSSDTYICDAALKKEPVFDFFKKLCEIRGNHDIDYVDFEWKYYQVYRGNQEERSPLKFSDLPMDVLEQVVGNLTLIDRLILRKVSHDLRNLVDSSEDSVQCEKIDFNFGYTTLKVELDNLKFCYEEIKDGTWSIISSQVDNKMKKWKEHRNFKQAMITDVSTILKNPKLRIGQIGFKGYADADMDEFLEFLKSLSFKLHVRSIKSGNWKWILSILQFLNPDKLEEIVLHGGFTVNEFAQMEQWKSKMRLMWCHFPKEVGLEQLLQFKEFRSDQFKLTDENLVKIRDNLHRSAHFEVLELKFYMDSALMNAVSMNEKIDTIMSENPVYDAETRRFSIPNSRDYFQLKFSRDRSQLTLTITRVFSQI